MILTTIILIIFVCVSAKVYSIYRKQLKFHEALNKFPGPKWLPIVGTSYLFIGLSREETWDTFKGLRKKFGPVYKLWFDWLKPVIFISKVQHTEVIFKSNVNINKAVDYELFKPWLGNGLFLSAGKNWKTNRNLLTPAFHFKILDKYSEIFSVKSNELAEIFETQLEKYIDVVPLVTNCALDIIAETAMGVKFDSLKNPNSKYINSILKICESIARRDENLLYWNNLLFSFTKLGRETKASLKIVKNTNMKVIFERREKFRQEKTNKLKTDVGIKQKLAFLDILLQLQEENGYTDEYLCDEVSTFMFAGQDTTAATVSYTLLALGTNPDIQARLQEELDSVLSSDQTLVTHQDINNMDYLDRVLKEVLRYFSIAPMIGRLLSEEITLDGVIIPPDVTVYVDLWQMHHDPELWPNPEKFDPDRFLPENSIGRNPYAFSPFSAGPRNCIGQKFGSRNAKIMIATLLKRFSVTCLESPESIREYFEVVLRPQNGIHIKFELRKA